MSRPSTSSRFWSPPVQLLLPPKLVVLKTTPQAGRGRTRVWTSARWCPSAPFYVCDSVSLLALTIPGMSQTVEPTALAQTCRFVLATVSQARIPPLSGLCNNILRSNKKSFHPRISDVRFPTRLTLSNLLQTCFQSCLVRTPQEEWDSLHHDRSHFHLFSLISHVSFIRLHVLIYCVLLLTFYFVRPACVFHPLSSFRLPLAASLCRLLSAFLIISSFLPSLPFLPSFRPSNFRPSSVVFLPASSFFLLASFLFLISCVVPLLSHLLFLNSCLLSLVCHRLLCSFLFVLVVVIFISIVQHQYCEL